MNSSTLYVRGRDFTELSSAMLAMKQPTKNATTRIRANGAAEDRRARSSANRPTLPVTCDVNEPIKMKPAELTMPAISAR